jgi:hypothetical protein
MFIQVRSMRVQVLVLMECLRLVFQHRETIYWCLVPLRDADPAQLQGP